MASRWRLRGAEVSTEQQQQRQRQRQQQRVPTTASPSGRHVQDNFAAFLVLVRDQGHNGLVDEDTKAAIMMMPALDAARVEVVVG